MPKNILKRITDFNKNRDPDLVKFKYAALTESPFRFFRGTCHLFYEDMPRNSFLLKSPHTWLCGDLHLENLGSFKGDNRLPYFDMNDFDESFLGPCLVDLARLCTSIFLAAQMLKISKADAKKLVQVLIRSYAKHLSAGYIRNIEQQTAKGFVRQFLDNIATRKRGDLLQKRLQFTRSGATLKYYNLTSLKANKKSRKHVKHALQQWAKTNTDNPAFYKVIDIANRANGTGSIGVERHLVLVNGNGHPNGYYLLDIKEASPASALEYLKFKQSKWHNEAERIIDIQRRVQCSSPAFLNTIKIDGKWFVMKELQPMEDKIDLTLLERDIKKFTQLLTDMGAILAWNNLRSGGRQGSAIADDLMRFGKKLGALENEIITYADKYATTTEAYWKEYCSSYASKQG